MAPPGNRPRHFRQPLRAADLAALPALAGVLALVFALDVRTGSAPVQHLYYVPIIFAAWRFGVWGGVIAPLAAIALYHAATPRLLTFAYEHWDFVQVALFMAVGLSTAEIAHDRRRLQELAATDDLTGLHNLRSFEQHLTRMLAECRDARAWLCLLALDVDRLKALNDTHGHLAGADAVRTVGRILHKSVRLPGIACRYGGDEFVVALPECSPEEARALADTIRSRVHSSAAVLDGISFPAMSLSVSIGVAGHQFDDRTLPDDAGTLAEELFRVADRALYRAKALGRNHVFVA